MYHTKVLFLLVPILYPISLTSLLFFRNLSYLSSHVKYLLAFYIFSQIFPSFFTENIILSLFAAFFKTLLTFGLISLGIYLEKNITLLKWYSIGLIVTLLLPTFFIDSNIIRNTSLPTHPFMTKTSLAISGMILLYITYFYPFFQTWRWFILPLSLLIIFLSGSRGVLFSTLLGVLFVFFHDFKKNQLINTSFIFIMTVIATLAYIFPQATQHLYRTDLTGRDSIWYNTLSIIQTHPIGGVGTYQFGKILMPPETPCTMFPNSNGEAMVCPEWIENLHSPWLIAHNLSLHSLAETGPIGLLGLLLLLSHIGITALNIKEKFFVAIYVSFLAINITDNILIVPSTGVAECFWILSGVILAKSKEMKVKKTTILFFIITILMSLPIITNGLHKKTSNPIEYSHLIYQKQIKNPKLYFVYFAPILPQKAYNIVMNSCNKTCVTIDTVEFDPSEQESVFLSGTVRNSPQQNIEILIYPKENILNPNPIGRLSWLLRIN